MTAPDNDTSRTVRETMPIQVGGELDLSERRGERPVIVRSIPWAMVADETAERQSQKNHSQSVERIAERGGYSAGEAVRVIAGLGWNGGKLCIPEREAHRILYAMVALFNRGQRVAEANALPIRALTAAPDLVRAAKDLLACIERNPGGHDYRPYFSLHRDSQLHDTSGAVIRLRKALEGKPSSPDTDGGR